MYDLLSCDSSLLVRGFACAISRRKSPDHIRSCIRYVVFLSGDLSAQSAVEILWIILDLALDISYLTWQNLPVRLSVWICFSTSVARQMYVATVTAPRCAVDTAVCAEIAQLSQIHRFLPSYRKFGTKFQRRTINWLLIMWTAVYPWHVADRRTLLTVLLAFRK
jgi:hypothetical protein